MIPQVGEIAAQEWKAVEQLLAPKKPWTPADPMPDWWESRTSPVIPAVWPPQQGAADFYVYLSAAARNPTVLVDGEWYSNPFGRIRGNLATRQFDYERFPQPPSKAGIQGVRPLRPEEVAVLRDSSVTDEFAAALARGSLNPELSARVRAYYKLWLGTHGVAKVIRPLHPAFFDWIEGNFSVEPEESETETLHAMPPKAAPPRPGPPRPGTPGRGPGVATATKPPGSDMSPLQIRLLGALMVILGAASFGGPGACDSPNTNSR